MSLITQIQDSIVIGSSEQFSFLIKHHSHRILRLKDSNGLTGIHIAVLYKRDNLLESIPSNFLSDTDCKARFGLTPLHFVLTKPTKFRTLHSYYTKLNLYPTTGEKSKICSFIKLFACSGAKLIRCEHNFTILTLAIMSKLHVITKTIMQYFELNVCDVFDYLNMLAYTNSDRTSVKMLCNVCRKRLVFLIKQGFPIGYTLVDIDPGWSCLYDEIEKCFLVEPSITIFRGDIFKLICLHKSIDIRNGNLFGEVAQGFIYKLSSLLKEFPTYLKSYDFSSIARFLFLYIILSLESTLSPNCISLDSNQVSWGNDLNCKLWQSALDHVNILWSLDPIKLDITPLVHTLFKFFDARLISILKPNYIFASDNKVPGRINFNFLCVYTTLFLYLSKEYSNYYFSSSYDQFNKYLQILFQSSRSRTHLISLLIHPLNYERTFAKYNLSVSDAILFLLNYDLDINQRSYNGNSILHEVRHQAGDPVPLIEFLVSVGVYPFSLDSRGNPFYHYFTESVQSEILKLPPLQRPYPLQTLCCLFIVEETEDIEGFQYVLPPHLFTFLKLHTEFTDA